MYRCGWKYASGHVGNCAMYRQDQDFVQFSPVCLALNLGNPLLRCVTDYIMCESVVFDFYVM